MKKEARLRKRVQLKLFNTSDKLLIKALKSNCSETDPPGIPVNTTRNKYTSLSVCYENAKTF
jgi:hypothetical protein